MIFNVVDSMWYWMIDIFLIHSNDIESKLMISIDIKWIIINDNDIFNNRM